MLQTVLFLSQTNVGPDREIRVSRWRAQLKDFRQATTLASRVGFKFYAGNVG